MNYINCQNNLSPAVIRKTIIFWCENSIQHISSLLSAFKGSGAVLNEEFLHEIKEIELIFKGIYDEYFSDKTNLPTRPAKSQSRVSFWQRLFLRDAPGRPATPPLCRPLSRERLTLMSSSHTRV